MLFCSNYDKPTIIAQRLQEQCRLFCFGVTSALKSQSSSPVYINMDLDVWRFITYGKGTVSEHRGNHLFEKDDMVRLKYYPNDWWHYLNQDGEIFMIYLH